MTCPRCRHEMVLIGSIGPRERFRCPHCGLVRTRLPQPTLTPHQLFTERYRVRTRLR